MVLEKYKKVFIDEILFLVFPRSRDGTAMQHENIPAKNIKQKNTRAKIKKSMENLWKQIYMEAQQTREEVKDVFPDIKKKKSEIVQKER